MTFLYEYMAALKNPIGLWHRDVAELYWETFQMKDMIGRLKRYRYLAA